MDVDEDGGRRSHAGRHAVVVPDMDLMRQRRIVNIGDLLRFEIEGQSIDLDPVDRISGYDIWFEPLPRAANGEVDRRAVVELLAAKRARRAGADRSARRSDGRLEAAIAGAIAARGHGGDVEPSSNLEIDLGIDSLSRVELIAELETGFGVRVDQERAAEWLTVADLAAAFGRAGATVRDVETTDPWPRLLADLPAPDADIGFILRDRPVSVGFLHLGMRILRSLMTRISVTGREHLPERGPYIITPNHQSYLDPFFLCSVLPYGVMRQIFVLGATEYFETPLTAWLARRLNLVAVDPDVQLVEAMRAAAFGLTHGRILLVFPEGERSIDGTVRHFKRGATVLSRHLNVPIVPVAIDGAFDVWPRNRKFDWRRAIAPPRHRVRIVIGQPVLPEATLRDDLAAQQLGDHVSALWRALHESP